MSSQQVQVASLLLQESFGELVEKVGGFLLQRGASTLAEIIRGTELEPTQVKKSLCVLIHHQLVGYETRQGGGGGGGGGRGDGGMLYQVNLSNLLLRVRFPRYIHTSKELFGDAGELIVEDLLQQGQSLMSQCIRRVSEHLEDAGVEHADIGQVVKQQFVALVEDHFLQRVRPPSGELLTIAHGSQDVGGVSTIEVYRRFELPPSTEAITFTSARKRKRSDSGTKEGQPSAKRARGEKSFEDDGKAVDAGIHWHVNYDRFHQHFRDQAIISAVAEKIDETAAIVMRTILAVSSHQRKDTTANTTTSAEVNMYIRACAGCGTDIRLQKMEVQVLWLLVHSLTVAVDSLVPRLLPGFLCHLAVRQIYTAQIAESLPDKPKLAQGELEQYLKVLVDDQANFLRKTGESGGGLFVVNFRHTGELLCQATVESIVRERFGSKCFRIFRLLLLKRLLEQHQVAEMAMIPSKEAKEMLYSLLAENFVTLQEIPRTPDYAPSRTFYLFSVNLLYVARLLLERCYKALGNLISRRMSETTENKRLLEKFQVFEHQQEVGGGEGELEEVLTPDEKRKVEIVKRSIAKLEHGEMQLDETIMTISNYISVHSSSAS